jgi:predicted enzyme related to lactoylglutathione lyase
MSVKSINLSWIVVKDFKKALEFYTAVIGLKVMEINEQYGWAELQGHEGGARLGIAQAQFENILKPGANACVTFTVENLEKAIGDLQKKGAKSVGEIQVIPGHVKLQMVVDHDGNHVQLVELLHA